MKETEHTTVYKITTSESSTYVLVLTSTTKFEILVHRIVAEQFG